LDDEIFKKTTVKDLVDECKFQKIFPSKKKILFVIGEDPKSNVAVSSDDDESSLITNCNNSLLNQFVSPIFIPNQSSPWRSYNSYLPPVVENTTDEIN
jgi:hypothetical protein